MFRLTVAVAGMAAVAWICAPPTDHRDAGVDAGATDAGPQECGCKAEGGCIGCPVGLVCDLADFGTGSCVTPHYTDNGNGTVTDDVTGLLWQQPVASNPCPADDTEDGTFEVDTCTWPAAEAYCQSLSLGGISSGWQVPTFPQLWSLMDVGWNGLDSPTYDVSAFPDTPCGSFWYAPYTPNGALLFFPHDCPVPVGTGYYVRCVFAGGDSPDTGTDGGP